MRHVLSVSYSTYTILWWSLHQNCADIDSHIKTEKNIYAGSWGHTLTPPTRSSSALYTQAVRWHLLSSPWTNNLRPVCTPILGLNDHQKVRVWNPNRRITNPLDWNKCFRIVYLQPAVGTKTNKKLDMHSVTWAYSLLVSMSSSDDDISSSGGASLPLPLPLPPSLRPSRSLRKKRNDDGSSGGSVKIEKAFFSNLQKSWWK